MQFAAGQCLSTSFGLVAFNFVQDEPLASRVLLFVFVCKKSELKNSECICWLRFQDFLNLDFTKRGWIASSLNGSHANVTQNYAKIRKCTVLQSDSLKSPFGKDEMHAISRL